MTDDKNVNDTAADVEVAPDSTPTPASTPAAAVSTGATQPSAPAQQADNSFWIKIVIFFTPLAAIIFYLLKRDDDPARARRALGTAWFAVVFWTIAGALFVVLGLLAFFIMFFASVAALSGAGGAW